MNKLRQVLLRHPTPGGHAEDVFWIDNELARKGKRVVDADGLVWTVEEVYNVKPFSELEMHRQTWKAYHDVLE